MRCVDGIGHGHDGVDEFGERVRMEMGMEMEMEMR